MARPPIAEQPRHGHVERLVGTLGWPWNSHCVGSLENGFGKPCRILLCRHLLPMREVEWDFDECGSS